MVLRNMDSPILATSTPEEVLSGFQALESSFNAQSHLPVDVLQLCRQRLRQLHGIGSDADASVEDVTSPEQSGLDACIAFTEVYAMDVQAISDELAAAVKMHFDDAGLVTLIEALGIFDGLIRLELLWRGDWS
jgi:hypothetical protein